MQSCLFEGEVWHERVRPVTHRLRYKLFMLYLDLDELPELATRKLLRVDGGFASAAFGEEDYLPRSSHDAASETTLAERVRTLVQTATGARPQGPIRLLCHLRYWGYYFSPLNLYYCFAADGVTLETVVAEVNNIPWRERHWYVLWSGNQWPPAAEPFPGNFQHPKAFHVSPFMPMDQQYRWKIGVPADFLRVGLENWDAGATIPTPVTLNRSDSSPSGGVNSPFEATHQSASLSQIFSASMVLQRQPLTRFRLGLNLFCHGWMSAKVVAAIYFEAFRLWLKKAPYYAHPPTPSKSVPLKI